MNIFSTQNRLGGQALAFLAAISMLLSFLPLSVLPVQAASTGVTTTVASLTLEEGEQGFVITNTIYTSSTTNGTYVSISDGNQGGVVYDANRGNSTCSSADADGKFDINKSKAFCYSNNTAGLYILTVQLLTGENGDPIGSPALVNVEVNKKDINKIILGSQDSVPVCHSAKGKNYTFISPNVDSIITLPNGHKDHNFDIIPDFWYNIGDGDKYFSGINWPDDALLYANDCVDENAEYGSITVTKIIEGGEAVASDFELLVDDIEVVSGVTNQYKILETNGTNFTVSEGEGNDDYELKSIICKKGEETIGEMTTEGYVVKLKDEWSVACEITNKFKQVPVCSNEKPGWADKIVAFDQGKKKNGNSVDPGRSHSSAVLGEADWSDGGNTGFVSLGFGGSLTVEFDKYVPDARGNDISIHEATNGNYPLEKAKVEVSQTGNSGDWHVLSEEARNDNNEGGNKVTLVDFSETGLTWIKYVRITDTSDKSLFSNKPDADGFDLDAVDATKEVCDKPRNPSGTLIVEKIVEGGSLTADDFSFTVNDGESIDFEADGSNEFSLPYGLYNVVEVDVPNDYVVIYENCSNISLSGNNEEQVCTITNTYQPTPACVAEKDLIKNGDFETPIVTNNAKWDIFDLTTYPSLSWQVAFTQNFAGAPQEASLELQRGVNGWLPSSGSQYAELDSDWQGPGGGSGEQASVRISQTVNTIPGANYLLRWDFSPRPNSPISENDLLVSVAGVPSANNTGTGSGANAWTSYSYAFAATTTATDISFADNGTPNSVGTFIDNVSLVCLPENDGEEEYTLTVDITGDGAGDVSSVVDGISCSTNGGVANVCQKTYTAGTVVDLVVTPDTGSNFNSSWTTGAGTCVGTTTPCQLTMNSDINLVAHFALNNTITTTGGGGGGRKIELTSGNGGGPTGTVAGESDSRPIPQVLGEQVSVVPFGAPNTGGGGASPASLPNLYPLWLGLAVHSGHRRYVR